MHKKNETGLSSDITEIRVLIMLIHWNQKKKKNVH